MHSQLSTYCPFLGAGGLGDKRYRGVSLAPPPPPTPVFFFPREQQALLAQSEMKSINSSPSSTGKGRLGKWVWGGREDSGVDVHRGLSFPWGRGVSPPDQQPPASASSI